LWGERGVGFARVDRRSPLQMSPTRQNIRWGGANAGEQQ
jgi:hypothetical protein